MKNALRRAYDLSLLHSRRRISKLQRTLTGAGKLSQINRQLSADAEPLDEGGYLGAPETARRPEITLSSQCQSKTYNELNCKPLTRSGPEGLTCCSSQLDSN
ncbi:hypothetical protein EVAR_54957_1 [Eumeta japonica]|uniref:Uncharacterized protein n=1 Tax=Eumeta variegata TaxID=151549 RepID=A0A4C1YME0_EUMVA|nr:hypothetical protein EVAR_54957_1 [Eumeta japonica]